jgi:hypothetical protein
MMYLFLWIVVCLETILLIVGGVLASRFLKRLFAYDEIFDLLQEDLDVNIQNFDKLKSTPLLSNAPEIVNASKLMSTMRDRLNEYVMRIEEHSLRERDEPVLIGIRGPDGNLL